MGPDAMIFVFEYLILSQLFHSPLSRSSRGSSVPLCSLKYWLYFITYLFPTCSLLTRRYCCCSVVQSCLTLCDPMDCSLPGFPVLHHLPELAQIHIHWVSNTIQPFYPLSSPSPPAFNLSQHPGFFLMSWLFASGGQCIGASTTASVLPMNIQDWVPLGLTGLISLQSKGVLSFLQHHSSKTLILRYSVFFMVQLSHPYVTTVWMWDCPFSFDYRTLLAK